MNLLKQHKIDDIVDISVKHFSQLTADVFDRNFYEICNNSRERSLLKSE